MSLTHQRRILKQVYDEFLKGRPYSRLCVKNISTGNLQNLRLRVAANIHPDCDFSGGTNSLTLPFCCRYSSYAATGPVCKTRSNIASSNFSNTNTISIVSVSDLGTSGKFNRSLFPINCFQKQYISKSKHFSTSSTTSSMPMASSSVSSDHQEGSNANSSEHHHKYMIVGLGNYDYPNTRHSVGMFVVDRIADYLQVKWHRDRAIGRGFVTMASTGEGDCIEVILLKSRKAMNENGKTIVKAAQHYGVEPSKIYLIHDNIDRPVGKFGIKVGGSAGGHNGVRSAIASLKTDVMPRLWLGVDRPADRAQVADYVLSKFESEERKVIYSLVNTCIMKLATHIEKDSGVNLISHFISEENVDKS